MTPFRENALNPKFRNPVNFRSVALGVVGVLFICGLTPYNDFVVANTFFTGNFLPVGLVLFFLVFVMLVNAPLSRWWPRLAFSGAELAVALGMTLVSCAIPSSGLMRVLPSQLVAPWYHAGGNSDYRAVLDTARLPGWFWPDFRSDDAAGRANDPVVQDFWRRAEVKDDSFVARWRAVPWRAWARPAIAWAIFFAALFGAVLCLAALVRQQWVENERLPFPLATLYVSLIEPPEPGRALGALFHRRSFWIACVAVFVIHGINALNLYDAKHFPEIPLDYDLLNITTEPPWSYADWFVRAGRFFFSIIGITYFVQARVAFSIWFFVLALQIPKMLGGPTVVQWRAAGANDQAFGAVLAFALMILWVGRHHWAMVVRQMIGARPNGNDAGRYLSHRAAGWGFVVCLLISGAWLVAAGASVLGSAIILFMFVLLIVVLMRVVAETGLIFVHFMLPMWLPWAYLFRAFPAMASGRATLRPFFVTAFFNTMLGSTQRESLSVYASTALRVTDVEAFDDDANHASRWRGTSFVAAMALALVIGYVVAGASTLYTEYAYASMLDREPRTPINPWAMTDASKRTLDVTKDLMLSARLPNDQENRASHFLLGAGLTGLLSVMNLRMAAWPFHPIGYLLQNSWTIWLTWPSIFVGWLAKVLILRFGGGRMFTAARPLFIGLIVGECSAAGFWLVVSLVRVACGLDYHAVNLLPM